MHVTPAELKTLFLFEALDDEQLTWLAERGTRRTFDSGAVLFRDGEPADNLFVLLGGKIRMTRPAAGQDVVVNESDQVGAYLGAVRSYVGDAQGYTGGVVTLAPSSFFVLPAEDFTTFMGRWFPMAVHLLDGLYIGVRNSEATVRQREQLARLGVLSANLAHELNNPAGAAVRATSQLRGRVAGMRHKLAAIAGGHVSPEVMVHLVRLQEESVERAAKERAPLSALAESDLEDVLGVLLADHGVSGPYELAAIYVGAGLDEQWLAGVVAQCQGSSLEGALRWLAYSLETEALMDEIEESTSRISTLVAAVKQYSYMDSGEVQEVDVHVGLDSTLTMLGHKLAGIEVVRDYDRQLPRVPVYAAELNQVWTNLIDNAADAIGDAGGTLTVRTLCRDDQVVVEIGDDGPGIPGDVQPRVFQAFFTTKALGQGSGLGLENARRIVVQRHHGEITFVTGPGGTTFRVSLPLAQTLS